MSLSESKASTQVSSFVNQLPIYGCGVFVCVGAYPRMFVPINLHKQVEVGCWKRAHNNCSDFIHFIY